MRLVEARWVDSHVHARWVAVDAVTDTRAARCRSVGYLVDESEDAITLAQSVGDGPEGADEYGQPLTIPRVALCGPLLPLHAGGVDAPEAC